MNVVFIMNDTWRYDHVGANGNDWIRTPVLDQFARESAVFDRADIAINPRGGACHPFGLHCAYALPAVTGAEFWVGSALGIPLDEANTLPGHSLPKAGLSIPPDRPGFGLEIAAASITPYFDQ